MKTQKGVTLKKLAKIFTVVLSALVLAFAIGGFILPHKLVTGGLSGLALVINRLLPIGESTWIALLTALFFIIGYFVFGSEFVVRSAVFSLLFPVFLFFLSPVFNRILISAPLAAILGGVVAGLSLSLAFFVGGSTGGVDVLALILSRRTRLSLAAAVFYIDATVILLGALVLKSVSTTMLGILSATVGSLSLTIFGKILSSLARILPKPR